MSTFTGNDDDLFEYEYDSSDEVKSEPTNAATHSFAKGSPNAQLIDDLKYHFDEDDSQIGNLHTDKIRLATAYHLALHSFVEETKIDALGKSITIALNTLTNGDFSLLKMFHETEMRIFRRMHFISLSHKSFDDIQSEESIANAIHNIFNIKFTDFYVQTCYMSSVRICEHAIIMDRGLYLTLSKQLGIPVKQYLFDDPKDVENNTHNVYLDDYEKTLSDDIMQRLLENGLMSNFSDMYGYGVAINVQE